MNVRFALTRNALALAVVAMLLAACATVPTVHTQSALNLDLTRYSTFGFVKHPGTDRGNYRSFTTQDLERAVTRQMQARGFHESAQPQLLIDFHTSVQNKVEGNWASPGYGWGWGWGWRGGWGPYWGAPGWWGPGPWGFGYGGWGAVQTYSEGTLTISVIDAKTQDAIWSGSAVALITRDTLARPQQSIDQSVGAIFAKFPKAPLNGATPR